jgi:hypothetical protein
MKKTIFIALFISILSAAFAQQKDLYDINHIPEIRITLKEKNWSSTLDSFKVAGNNMLIGDVNIDGTVLPSAGIRYRGTNSFKYGEKRNPYYIKLNLVNNSANYQGNATLVLSSALRDPSMVREVMGFEIARKYMVAPRANYAKLYVNNEYIGLYANIEPIEESFLTKNFGDSENAFFKCSADPKSTVSEGCRKNTSSSLELEENVNCYMPNYELLSKKGWDELVELIKTLNKDPENLEKVLDVDAALWMLAYNNVLVNLNSYSGHNSQNYYLYKNKSGKFVPMIWDLNLSFGSFKSINSGSDLPLKELQELDPMLNSTNPLKPLISQLLKNPFYEKVYIAHIRQILADNIDNAWYEKRAKELQSNIKVSFMNDQNKYYQDKDMERNVTMTVGEKSKIPGLTELMSKRTKFLKKSAALTALPPLVSDLKITAREKYAKENISKFNIQAKIDRFPKKVRVFYRANKDNPWMETQMFDDGKSGDGAEGDKVFGVAIDPKGAYDSIEYFFIVENKEAIGFYPNDYINAPAKASLINLNK